MNKMNHSSMVPFNKKTFIRINTRVNYKHALRNTRVYWFIRNHKKKISMKKKNFIKRFLDNDSFDFKKNFHSIIDTIKPIMIISLCTTVLFVFIWICFEANTVTHVNITILPSFIVWVQKRIIFFILSIFLGTYVFFLKFLFFIFPMDFLDDLDRSISKPCFMQENRPTDGSGPLPIEEASTSRGRGKRRLDLLDREGSRRPSFGSRGRFIPPSSPEEAPGFQTLLDAAETHQKAQTLWDPSISTQSKVERIKEWFPKGPTAMESSETKVIIREYYETDFALKNTKNLYSKSTKELKEEIFENMSIKLLKEISKIDSFFQEKWKSFDVDFLKYLEDQNYKFQCSHEELERAIIKKAKDLKTHPFFIIAGDFDTPETRKDVFVSAVEIFDKNYSSPSFLKDQSKTDETLRENLKLILKEVNTLRKQNPRPGKKHPLDEWDVRNGVGLWVDEIEKNPREILSEGTVSENDLKEIVFYVERYKTHF